MPVKPNMHFSNLEINRQSESDEESGDVMLRSYEVFEEQSVSSRAHRSSYEMKDPPSNDGMDTWCNDNEV